MAKRKLGRIAILGATVAFVLLGFFPTLLPFHRVLFVLFFLYLVLLPGWLLSLRLVPSARGFMLTMSSFACGTTLAFVVLYCIAIAGGDIRLIRIIIPGTVILLSLWKLPARGPAEIIGEPGRAKGEKIPPILLAVLVVIVGALILKTGDPLIYTSDSPDHIAYIRTISNTHQVFPEHFYYPESGVLTRDIRKGMIHALLGAINSLTGSSDVVAIWPVIGLIGSAFLLISLYCAGLALFGSAAIGLVAAVLCVLFYGGGLADHQLVYNAAGYAFGKAFYVFAFAFLPRCLSSPRPGQYALVALSLFAATGTHIAFLAFALFVIAVFSLSSVVTAAGTERRLLLTRRIPLLFGAALLPNVPYLLLRYTRDYAPNNALHTEVQGVLFFTKHFYVMNPVVFFEAAGPLGALALVAVFILWKRARIEKTLMLLFHGIIAVYLLLFVPFWYPFLLAKLSYLLLRFEFAVPSMLVAAYLLRELWEKLRNRNSELAIAPAVIGGAAAIVLLGFPLARTPSGFAYGERAMSRPRAGSYRNLGDLFDFLNRNVPPGSVVAADPVTSFGIPAFTDDYVICPFDQHSTPNDSTAIERIRDCRRIFSPLSSLSDVKAILVKHGAEYLVVNGRIPAYVETLYWKPDSSTASALSEKLRESKSPFRIVYERNGLSVAKLVVGPTRTAIERVDAHISYVGDSLDATAVSRLTRSGIGGVGIAQVRPERSEAARGETINVDITWVATDTRSFGSYEAFLRFDTDFAKNALYREWFGKPYRKILEKLAKHRFRFRIDFQPLGGVVPPDTWPPLREVHDRVHVTIPEDVAPGAYTISLKLAEKPHYPNYVLGDILTDDDFYSGAAVAAVRVR
ncbi:MAG TPA: hypothetical protein VMT60_03455 [Candidatus Bathyarchaeia archaeon]|nr:hypothetical protein [Candidatus Bathyarchaeia archaeon]